MLQFDYRIVVQETLDPTLIKGGFRVETGENRLVLKLPEGIIRSVTARVPLRLAENVRIFMNGYQAWTYCPEYTARDVQRDHAPLPRVLVDRFLLDRCADYHFVDYPNRRGAFHGFSYCYFRVGTRYRLLASLDERPGYTIFRYDAARGELSIERDCGGVHCDGEYHAFDLFCAEGTESEVFDAWFAAMGVQPRTAVQLAGYSSWYNRYQNINAKCILDDLNGCAPQLAPGDLFQIDDGWEPFVGDWMEPDGVKFLYGMKDMADAIHEKGLRAGLWLAPFVAQKGSALLREHPDWFLTRNKQPWADGSNWGGFYSLDIDRSEVRDYLARVFRRVFDEWGFDLVKLDFLYAAAPFGTRDESRAARMIRAMELLRQWCGEHPILGCGVPLMPAFGLVDYCRIGCDVTLDWDDKLYMRLIHRERPSTRRAVGNVVFRRALNGRAFLNDPDVFFLRDDNVKLSAAQKKQLAVLDAALGGVLLHSDDMSRYGEDARQQYALLRRLREATDVRVDTEGKWVLRFRLNDAPCQLPLDALRSQRRKFPLDKF